MKILIVDRVHPVLLKILANNKIVCDYFPAFSYREVINRITDYNGIVIRSKVKLTKKILSKTKKLKLIARLGSGMENVDVTYAREKNIECINSPEGNRNAVAEHALGMLLGHFNNIYKGNNEVKQGIWLRQENSGIELEGKTVGIIGYGNTGSEFAEKLSGFNVTVLAYDKYKMGFGNDYIREVSLNEIFQFADILSLHIPQTEETICMVDDEYIKTFKKNIYLINTSRGKIVNTKDLVKNLQSGKILGAMLDVLEYESQQVEMIKTEDKKTLAYLQQSEKVLLTPHIAGLSKESFKKLSEVLATKIVNHFGLK